MLLVGEKGRERAVLNLFVSGRRGEERRGEGRRGEGRRGEGRRGRESGGVCVVGSALQQRKSERRSLE